MVQPDPPRPPPPQNLYSVDHDLWSVIPGPRAVMPDPTLLILDLTPLIPHTLLRPCLFLAPKLLIQLNNSYSRSLSESLTAILVFRYATSKNKNENVRK